MALILVAEDEPISQKLICTVIEKMGHVPVRCRNGRLALEVLEDNPLLFSLLITDIMMPELDGHGLLRKIREQKGLAALPIIIQSAYLGVQATAEMIEQGASAVLHKPIDTDLLREYILSNMPPAKAT
ncbi:MAG: response regulator [Myxococcota bacterium]|jgi:CheY-like chemotaxis protein|nr:response regulator [Myxococcota bacterium]